MVQDGLFGTSSGLRYNLRKSRKQDDAENEGVKAAESLECRRENIILEEFKLVILKYYPNHYL